MAAWRPIHQAVVVALPRFVTNACTCGCGNVIMGHDRFKCIHTHYLHICTISILPTTSSSDWFHQVGVVVHYYLLCIIDWLNE